MDEKIEILQILLQDYNDGRRKNFFCIAVSLLELEDIQRVMEKIVHETNPEQSIKEKALIAVRLFQAIADERNIMLKLRKK